MSTFSGKTALITGGNSGIGFATAQHFIAQGAEVIITARRADALAESLDKLGPKAKGILSDAGSESDLMALSAQIGQLCTKLDAVFVNAGVAFFVDINHIDLAHYHQVMDINVKGALFTAQAALPYLQAGSSITFNASVVADFGMPGSAVYAASKAAVLSLARVLAVELAAQGIRVNAVSPGPIETPIYNKVGMSPEQLDGFSAVLASKVPQARFGSASDVAALVLFLASPEAGYITGANMPVAGGLGLNPMA